MTAELEVLHDAVTRLEHAGIAYMLTGSIALSYYAEPRMTRDIDVVAELSGRAAKSIAALFTPDYYASEADITAAVASDGIFNVLHLAKLVKLDFIVRKDTPYRRHEFERRRRVRLPGFEAWIVSREDLILSKLAWAKDSGSELQLRDVRALLAGGADRTYLECLGERARGNGDAWGYVSMKDTTSEFRKLVREGYARMAPEDRVRVCTEMFDTAVAVAAASLPEDLDPAERRFRLCERLYGDLAARALPRR
ncbi:MAG TPA: hypothetical protein VGA25_08060 [Burkholderiales bacterium]